MQALVPAGAGVPQEARADQHAAPGLHALRGHRRPAAPHLRLGLHAAGQWVPQPGCARRHQRRNQPPQPGAAHEAKGVSVGWDLWALRNTLGTEEL